MNPSAAPAALSGAVLVLQGATVLDENDQQRELRNDNAEVMRGLERGETYTITRRGVPVARLVPITDASDLRCDRPARSRPTYSGASRVRLTTPSVEILDDLRSDR